MDCKDSFYPHYHKYFVEKIDRERNELQITAYFLGSELFRGQYPDTKDHAEEAYSDQIVPVRQRAEQVKE